MHGAVLRQTLSTGIAALCSTGGRRQQSTPAAAPEQGGGVADQLRELGPTDADGSAGRGSGRGKHWALGCWLAAAAAT